MDICGYRGLEKHRGLHRELITQVSDLAGTWREDRDPEIPSHIRKFLRNWLYGHIIKEDTEIFRYTKGKEQDIRKALESLG